MCLKNNLARLSLLLILMIIIPSYSFSQEASAELIATVKPAKLKSGEQGRDGIKNLFFQNQLLYVTNIWSGLQVLDVSDVNHPREIGNYITENRSRNCFVDGTKAYLCSELLGIIILDVTNPAAIKNIGMVKTVGDPNYVVASGNYIYVAEETKGINIYDVANPASPYLKGSYDTPGWAWGLFIDGKTLYLADKSGGLIILDVTNPANPTRLGQYKGMRYAKTVQVEDGIAYVSNGADGLWIFDVTNPAFPKLLSKINVGGYVYNCFKAGNSVFVANETKKRMDIINVTNPSSPKKEGDFVTDSKVYACWKNNVYVYIAADTKTIIVRHNHPPVITQLTDMSVDENSQLLFSAEAIDPDGDNIFFTIDNMPEGASFDSSSGVFNWTPTYDQSGIYPNVKISVVEKTDSKLSTSTSFKITVNHVNRPPTLPDVADTSVYENKTISFTLAEGSDPDIEDKGRLKYRAENMPEGAVFNEKTRTFSWTPTYEQSGIYTIDFIVEDPGGLLMRDGATITVYHVDRKPHLVKVDDFSIDENTTHTFTLEGSDPDKEDQNALSYRAENLPEGATFDPASATFSWTPTYDQSGQYNNVLFIFTAGKLSDSTSVNITVNHVNRSPVLEAITAQTTNENDSLVFTVTGSDPDVEDAGKLTYEASNLPEGAVFDGPSRTFTWVPTYDQSGEYKDVTFTVKDPDGLSDSKSTNITVIHVNRSPVLEDIAAKVVDENAPLTFDLVGSDPDVEDQNKLVYSAQGLPEGAKLEGKTFSWTPTYDQSGNYTVEFTITDGALSQSKSASITVNHVNRNPVLDDIADQTVDENALLTFKITGSDPDVEDAGKFVLSATNLPEGATFDPMTGTFNWTPTFDQSGEYTVTFVNTDPQGLTAEKQVKITVNHVNRTPEFPVQDAQTINENELLTFTLKPATDPDVEDKGKLQYSAANLPEGAAFDAATQTFTWTPTYDQSGSYTVTFTVKDSEFSVDQPVTITVVHVNRVPVIETINAQNVDENKNLTLKINATDPDKEDEGKVTVSVTNLPQGAVFDAPTTTISWTPTYEQAGTYSGITVTASDPAGLSAQATFDITVNNVNLAPEIAAIQPQTVDENNPMSVTLSASDPDKEDVGKIVLSVENMPEGALFDATTGTITWTPTYDQSGTYTVKAIATDAEGLKAETDLTINVNNVNRSPEIQPITAQTIDENSALSVPIVVSDPDKEDAGNLKIAAENLPQGATLNESAATINWTPTYDQSGSYTVNVSVADKAGLKASTSFDITVNHVNRAPQFSTVSDQTVEENSALKVVLSATDPDKEDNNKVKISVNNLPKGASFDEASNTLSWTPDFKQKGSYTVNAVATDPSGLTSETSFNITVTNLNRDPEISGPATGEVEAGSTLSLSYKASDPDDDDVLKFSVEGAPSGVSINSDGNLTWTPTDSQAGSHSITVVVSDGTSKATTSLTVTVKAKPKPVTPAPADTTGSN